MFVNILMKVLKPNDTTDILHKENLGSNTFFLTCDKKKGGLLTFLKECKLSYYQYETK